MTIAELREAIKGIDGDVKVNLVIGSDDWDAYSGWNPAVFRWEPGQEHVTIFGHESDNETSDPHPNRI